MATVWGTRVAGGDTSKNNGATTTTTTTNKLSFAAIQKQEQNAERAKKQQAFHQTQLESRMAQEAKNTTPTPNNTSERARGRNRGGGGRGGALNNNNNNNGNRRNTTEISNSKPKQKEVIITTTQPHHEEEETEEVSGEELKIRNQKKFREFQEQARIRIQKLQTDENDYENEDLNEEELTYSSSLPTCVICINKVLPKDDIWQCEQLKTFSGCYQIFHLKCIQQWSQSSCATFAYQLSQTRPDLHPQPHDILWNCPNCRAVYNFNQIPSSSLCFCNKIDFSRTDSTDENQRLSVTLWQTPHSCGSVCDKPLKNRSVLADSSSNQTPQSCGHTCLQLCHPGQCPPCPRTIPSCDCYCGAESIPRRCSDSLWSCGNTCDALLDCKTHSCPSSCHSGSCPPCNLTSNQACHCGKHSKTLPCTKIKDGWSCGERCNLFYDCGIHTCSSICHPHSTTLPCPYKLRSCPCGKKQLSLPCRPTSSTESLASLSPCGDTCNKILACGVHTCPSVCHQGACAPCTVMVQTPCRCGSSAAKRHLCSAPVQVCSKKCTRLKSCGKHPCKRKCCDGNCSECTLVCGGKLKCGNHKCPLACHPGPCLPCSVTVEIACPCGTHKVVVPCGAERTTSAPDCKELCKIPRLCHHEATGNKNEHLCHWEKCPDCKEVCNKKYKTCEHCCQVLCHDWVPGEEECPVIQQRREKQRNKTRDWTKKNKVLNTNALNKSTRNDRYLQNGFVCLNFNDMWKHQRETQTVVNKHTPCPPCKIMIEKTCLGLHSTKPFACSDFYTQFSQANDPEFWKCDLVCGRTLSCTNHKCRISCHKPTDTCEVCQEPCKKVRTNPCEHGCPQKKMSWRPL